MHQPQIPFARELRKQMTDAERVLWPRLRARRLGNYKFKRQVPNGPYVLDFVCEQAKLVIEVDGGQHMDNAYDMTRDRWLERRGYRVLRFWNNEVTNELDAVLERILEALNSPSPYPLPHAGEGLSTDA